MEIWIRFLIGGLFVALFSFISDSIKPKTFAGLFSAAPSIALAGLILALYDKGPGDVVLQARSMIYGSLAMTVYCVSCGKLVETLKFPTWLSAGLLWIEWLIAAGLFYEVLLT